MNTILNAAIKHSLAPCALMLAISLSGCGEPMTEDYDRSCERDEDCAVVILARDCQCDEAAAVNVSEVEQVEHDNERANRREYCPHGEVLNVRECYNMPTASCQANTCEVKAYGNE